MDDPSKELLPPRAHDQMPAALDHVLHLPDLASLAQWTSVLIDWATHQTWAGPVDLADFLGKEWAGDWRQVSKAADALTKLSKFSRAASSGVSGDDATVMATWEGNAADAADKYFTRFAKQLGEVETALNQLSNDYQSIAFGVYENANATGAGVESVIDLAIAAGIEAGVDMLLAELKFAPGVAVFSVAVALDVGMMLAKVSEVVGHVSTAWSVIDGVMGSMAEACGVLAKFRRLELPPDPYDFKLA